MRKTDNTRSKKAAEKKFDPNLDMKRLVDRIEELERELTMAKHAKAESSAELETIAAEQKLLSGAFESLSDGFALFDPDDRLIFCNTMFKELNPELAASIQPGMTFEQMLRDNIKHRRILGIAGREEAFVRERMEQHRNPGEPILSARKDGRWLLLREERTPDGCTFLVNTDLTELKRREEALKESEARHRAILDNVPAALFLKDAEGRYKFINSSYANWFEIDPATVKGRTVHEMFAAERAQRYDAGDREIVETLSTVIDEVDIPLPSGETRTFVLTKFPILNNGELTDIGGVMIDITERKTAENAVREKASILEATMKTIPDGLQVLDRDLNLVAWNDQLFTVLGIDKKEILESDDPGKALRYALADRGAYGDGDRDELVASREELARLRDGVQFERVLDNGNWIECRGLPIEEDEGWVAVFRDISERRKLENMKNEFISTVSHELRTPLTSIYGSLGLVQNGLAGDLPERAQELVDIAHRNCERLVSLVNDILDMEKIEAGKFDYTMAPVQISDLIRDAMETNSAYGAQFGVTFEILGGMPDLIITGDYQRLLQVLTNLLSNASKHSHDGGRVAISVNHVSGSVKIAVQDWGGGIPEEFHDTIFDKFTKVDSTNSQDFPGTGLGLSICRSIIDHHGGEIGFDSKSGEGSTFYFELPVGYANE